MLSTRLLATAALLALSVDAATLTLHLFNETTFPNARCNDGTCSGYYFRPGTSSHTWIVQQQGGGWCYNERTCKDRLADSSLVSSKTWKPEISISDGIFNTSD